MSARRTPTALGAGLRSLLVPGWGQVVSGRPGIGWALIVVSLTSVAALVAMVSSMGAVEVLAALSDPGVLLVILGLNLVLAAIRLLSTGHAWWASGGRHWLAALVLALLVAVPHYALAWVGTETRSTLLEVFAPPAAPPPPTTTTTTAVTTTTTTTVPSTTTTTATVVDTTTTTTVPPTTTTTEPAPPDRLNVLLLGGDAGPGRPGLRTDTVMVASFDPASGDAALIGLPRNYGGLTFSDGTPFPGRMLKEVYGWGRDHPEVFGGIDPGASAVRDVAEHLTGLEIDYFMLVDLTGFAEVIDAFGGVTLDVPRAVYGPLYDPETGGYEMITIPIGRQTLDGGEALAYSRARIGTSDYVRMGRQRCVLAAMVEEANPAEILARWLRILATVRTHVTTDLPLNMVPDLIRFLPRVSADDIRVIGFDRSWGRGITPEGHTIPDLDRIRAAVGQLVSGEQPEGTVEILTASEACS